MERRTGRDRCARKERRNHHDRRRSTAPASAQNVAAPSGTTSNGALRSETGPLTTVTGASLAPFGLSGPSASGAVRVVPALTRSNNGHKSGHHASPRRRKRWRGPLRMLGLVAITLAAVFVLRTYVVATFYIPSGSMEPTLHGCTGCQPDLVIVDKLSYRFGSISRADVVVFDKPPLAQTEDDELIKRVIGLPGETVSAHDGQVYIGSKALNEPYLNPACHGTASFAAVKVPPGRYFMMGDNRCNSADSRVFGTVAKDAIVGRAFAVIWPWKHLRWL